jgi:ribosomal-protein-alanine N-acetyltransferase
MYLQLVPLTPDLLSQIKAIAEAGLGNFWSLSAYEREMASPHSVLLGAITENKLLLGFGCLWRVAEEAHITILVVHPDYQGQGIGKYILWGLLKEAANHQAEWAVLEVRESNYPALQLYRYFGFETVGQRKNYYQDTGETALVLWRKGLHKAEFACQLLFWQTAIYHKLFLHGWEIITE